MYYSSKNIDDFSRNPYGLHTTWYDIQLTLTAWWILTTLNVIKWSVSDLKMQAPWAIHLSSEDTHSSHTSIATCNYALSKEFEPDKPTSNYQNIGITC